MITIMITFVCLSTLNRIKYDFLSSLKRFPWGFCILEFGLFVTLKTVLVKLSLPVDIYENC